MTEKIEMELISRRRAFSLFGLTAALSFAVPATMLTVSDAQAQTPGMERRDDRQQGRQDRRDDRQEGRQDRRDGGDQSDSTGSSGSGSSGSGSSGSSGSGSSGSSGSSDSK
jgi:hypothetical protein